MFEAALLDLGVMNYSAARYKQLELVELRKSDSCLDTLILVEHPHVITVGRRRDSQNNVLAPQGIDVVEVERGGDVTYHGPGQVVAYPIMLLRDGERDLHRYLRNLEEAMIATCAAFGLDSHRHAGRTGVWRGERKLGSIGISCRRWITFHGAALNVATDLSYFERIHPCGFDSSVMTSMENELGKPVPLDEVKIAMIKNLGTTLGRRFSG